jgi:hypothetical protein
MGNDCGTQAAVLTYDSLLLFFAIRVVPECRDGHSCPNASQPGMGNIGDRRPLDGRLKSPVAQNAVAYAFG